MPCIPVCNTNRPHGLSGKNDWKYSQNDNITLVKVKLCLIVTSDSIFIEDVFIAKVETGYLGKGFRVKKDSAGFEPLGKCQH